MVFINGIVGNITGIIAKYGKSDSAVEAVLFLW